MLWWSLRGASNLAAAGVGVGDSAGSYAVRDAAAAAYLVSGGLR